MNTAMSFSDLKLTRKERRLLKIILRALDSRNQFPLTEKNRVLAEKLISADLAFSTTWVQMSGMPDRPERVEISDRGLWYLSYVKTYNADRRSDLIRYIITTAIAVIALIKAFLPELSALLA